MPLIMFVSSSFNTYVNLPKKKRLSHQHTHTHKVQRTRSFINLNCLTYMSGYAFIYSDSKLKINPNGPLMWTYMMMPTYN